MVFDENLENRIKDSLSRRQNSQILRGKIDNTQMQALVKAQARDGQNQPIPLPPEMLHAYWAGKNYTANLDQLTQDIQLKEDEGGLGGYKKVISNLPELSEEGKLGYYASLLGELKKSGAIDENASEDLQNLAEVADRAKLMMEYVRNGDTDGLDKFLRTSGIDPALLDANPIEVAYYRAYNPAGLAKIGGRMVAGRFNFIGQALKAKPKLMKEIDKIVNEKKQYGVSALELYSMHNSEGEQQYRIDVAEAKEKNITDINAYREAKINAANKKRMAA